MPENATVLEHRLCFFESGEHAKAALLARAHLRLLFDLDDGQVSVAHVDASSVELGLRATSTVEH